MILEITPKGTNGLFLNVDEDRHIIFEKLARNVDLKKFLASPVRSLSQKAWEGNYVMKSHRRVIAAADPSLATTIPIPLELPRERANTKSKITIAELENLIAQEMAKIFNGCRSEAAKRMGVNDLDAVLVGAKTKHLKVDGKAVAHPSGLPGKKISLLLEFTFTTRRIFEDLKPFFNSPDNFFFAEAPQAHLFALSRVRALPLSLIVADDDSASLYVLETPKDEHAVLYREKLKWSFSAFLRQIMGALGVDKRTAEGLYCLYHRGEMSEGAKRSFKKAIQPALDRLFKEIEKGKLRGSVYVDMPHQLPVAFPHKHGAATLEEPPIGELLAELGFTADLAAVRGRAPSERGDDILHPLLYFFEAYFDKSGSEINQKLRRRLHWLTG